VGSDGRSGKGNCFKLISCWAATGQRDELAAWFRCCAKRREDKLYYSHYGRTCILGCKEEYVITHVNGFWESSKDGEDDIWGTRIAGTGIDLGHT